MSVKVDRRVLRALHEMLGRDQRRLWPVIENARDRDLRAHAVPRADLRGARRALLPWLDLGAPRAARSAVRWLLRRQRPEERDAGDCGIDERAAHERASRAVVRQSVAQSGAVEPRAATRVPTGGHTG